VIGITTFDMYAYGATAPFVFDWRQDGRFAVISSSHLDPNNYLRPITPELLRSRVQKLMTRNLGMLMFGLQLNGDPSSVLSATLSSIEDIDRIGSELPF
jgi:predicted Zn-dependent protease